MTVAGRPALVPGGGERWSHNELAGTVAAGALQPDAKEPHYVLTIPEQDVMVFVGVRSRQVTVGPRRGRGASRGPSH